MNQHSVRHMPNKTTSVILLGTSCPKASLRSLEFLAICSAFATCGSLLCFLCKWVLIFSISLKQNRHACFFVPSVFFDQDLWLQQEHFDLFVCLPHCPVSYRPAISVTLCRHRCRCPVSYHTKTCRRVDHTAISVTVCRHGCRCPVSYHTAISVTVCRHRRRCPVRITTETLTNHIYYIITTFIDLAI